MSRVILWSLSGILLGIAVHLVFILSLPTYTTNNIWNKISGLDNFEKIVVLAEVTSGSENPLKLDPELLYGVCRLDLAKGVGILDAKMPGDFWSVSIFDATGRAVYGTTNRSIVGQSLKLGIFNDEQTKLLSNQELDIEEGLLIVESKLNDVFVVLRVAPPYKAVRGRYKEQLAKAICVSA